MQFERWYGSDYFLILEKDMMSSILFHYGDTHKQLLLEYQGAVMHHNIRLISGKDVEWNLQRVIRFELRMHSLIGGK